MLLCTGFSTAARRENSPMVSFSASMAGRSQPGPLARGLGERDLRVCDDGLQALAQAGERERRRDHAEQPKQQPGAQQELRDG
jgi:hypothetical protein